MLGCCYGYVGFYDPANCECGFKVHWDPIRLVKGFRWEGTLPSLYGISLVISILPSVIMCSQGVRIMPWTMWGCTVCHGPARSLGGRGLTVCQHPAKCVSGCSVYQHAVRWVLVLHSFWRSCQVWMGFDRISEPSQVCRAFHGLSGSCQVYVRHYIKTCKIEVGAYCWPLTSTALFDEILTDLLCRIHLPELRHI